MLIGIDDTDDLSSACLEVGARAARVVEVIDCCREFLLSHSAPGADAGLCVAAREQVDSTVIAFGQRAKADVLRHAATRGRLRLAPGHQGLVWIGLLTVGRLTSAYRWAGSVAALGALGAAWLPLWRLGDPFLEYATRPRHTFFLARPVLLAVRAR